MAKMREDSSRSVTPGEKRDLEHHLEIRRRDGVTVNINHLGEAVLGEEEALTRLRTYEKDLENPRIQYISVKISTIYSQISSLAFDHTVHILEERLSRLLRAAAASPATFTTRWASGSPPCSGCFKRPTDSIPGTGGRRGYRFNGLHSLKLLAVFIGLAMIHVSLVGTIATIDEVIHTGFSENVLNR